MVRASKRAKTTGTTAKTTTGDDVAATANPGTVAPVATPGVPFVPFSPGPSLERIPDDVLQEILSHLPTMKEFHILFQVRQHPPVVPSDALARTPALRALSQASRLLRLRCLAMAWQSVELCGASLPKHEVTFFKAIAEATRAAAGVLNACPHLLPLIQTVSVCFTRYQSAEIIPIFAACLAKLPNLTTIQVIHAHSLMTTAIKKGFEGKQFPSVRRISLPSCAHEIIKCCPNLEEVICTEDSGSTIIGSLVKGRCHQVRVIKGISAPLTRLVKVLQNLRYIDVAEWNNVKPLVDFALLDTIEIQVCDSFRDAPLSELARNDLEAAIKILKDNKSQAEKSVILTRRKFYDNMDETYLIKEVIKV